MVAFRKDQRKEAGHYSGLNENKRSKTLFGGCNLQFAHGRLPATVSNNEIRIAHFRFSACHQSWGQSFIFCLSAYLGLEA